MKVHGFRILHVAPIGEEWHEGLTYSIPSLVRAQYRCKAKVELLCTHPKAPHAVPEDFPVIYYRDGKREDFLGGTGQPPFALLVFHSTYIPFQARLGRIARRRGIPYIITPRGAMTRGAMRLKSFKKKLGNYLFFSRMVREASALHFLTENEAAESAGWKRPYFVVPNGIHLPLADSLSLVRRKDNRVFRFVFIGRLDAYHKGLDLLLGALNRIDRGTFEFRVSLHGPGGPGSTLIRELIARHKLEGRIELPGPVYGEQKTRALQESDVFVLTSRFEGLPMAALEALAHGVPCLLTPGTNLADEVAQAGAGWRVEGTPEAIAAGIERILKERARLPEMSRNARRLAEERFSWDTVARRTLEEYRKVVEKGLERRA